MEWIWPFVFGVAVGFAVMWWGTWTRMHRIESDVRHVVNLIATECDMEQTATVPAEWVADQLDYLIERNFR